MLKTFALIAAIGVTSVLLSLDCNAIPLATGKTAAVESNTILVRDGCGRHRHFSEHRGHCVGDRVIIIEPEHHHRHHDAERAVHGLIRALTGNGHRHRHDHH